MSEADTARLEAWAHQRVHMSIGWGMMLSQEANKALRHCAIGLVTDKAMKSRPKHRREFWRNDSSTTN
jgi:hypothetical protein